MSSPVKTGQDIERYLKDYLRQLSISPKRFSIIEKDLRIMKAGSQGGLDINWKINFDLYGLEYRWFLEAKGTGKKQYKKTGRYKNFQMNIIADKLLQLLGRSDLNIDCWCLFAPYLRLDENDDSVLRSLEYYLPFKLIIWDKNYLYKRIWSISESLFKKIYFTKRKYPAKGVIDPYIADIKRDCIAGRFIMNINKNYYFIKQELKDKCERQIILCKELSKRPKQPKTSESYKHFFEFQGVKYFIDEKELKKVLNDFEISGSGRESVKSFKKDNLINVFNNATSGEDRSLYQEIRGYLLDDDLPFAKFVVIHKLEEFKEVDFIKLNSSSYFGVENNKDILFENIVENF
ncbi:MAG: hypothetical protein HQ530_00925 [Parcubacteria group bacterium]|nr:hypothetical protein [Parcubacteria group bacterium]